MKRHLRQPNVMLKFNAHDFVGISASFGQIMMVIASGNTPSDESIKIMGDHLTLLERHCQNLDLGFSLARITQLRNDVKRPGIQLDDIRAGLEEIQRRVWDELATRTFFALNPGQSEYYFDDHFPQVAKDRFPDACFDMSEAGKSLALERPTACAFHLMRVAEYAVHDIARLLGMPDDLPPNWDPVIRKIDAELKANYSDRQFKGSYDLLANISAHLHAVKIAWRNRAMHIEKKHSMEEAREMYGATCGLMRYLGEDLSSA